VRGDRVEIVIDAGNEVRTYDIVATRNGRRVEIETGRGLVTVTEVTRSGNPVRMARFMASRVLALVEHPAAESPATTESAPVHSG
jgi:predicted RecB family endonuclease